MVVVQSLQGGAGKVACHAVQKQVHGVCVLLVLIQATRRSHCRVDICGEVGRGIHRRRVSSRGGSWAGRSGAARALVRGRRSSRPLWKRRRRMHVTRSSSTVGSSNGRSSRRGGRGKQGRRRAWLESKGRTAAARVVGHTIKGASMPGVRRRNICTGSELSRRLSKRGLATPWWVDEGESDRSGQSTTAAATYVRRRPSRKRVRAVHA